MRHFSSPALRTRALAALLLAGTAMALPEPSAAQQAQAERLALTYRVYIGGVSVLDARAELSLGGGRYTVRVAAETEGFLARLVPWSSQSHSVGTVRADGLTPDEYRASSIWRGTPRSVTLRYAPDGGVTAEAVPPPEEDDRDPVPREVQRGASDPLTAVVSALRNVAATGSCSGTVPVFDGRHRYDMLFGDLGVRQFAPSPYSRFAGAARHCRAAYRSIAGQWRNRERSRLWQRSPDDERPPIDVFVATVRPNQPPVPVRAETDSPVGTVLVHLIDIAVLPDTAARP